MNQVGITKEKMQYFNSKKPQPLSKTAAKSNMNVMNMPIKWIADDERHWRKLNETSLAKARQERNAQIATERGHHRVN